MTLSWASHAIAYMPQSPEVQAILQPAVRYLETKGKHSRVGGKALIGLALLKSGKQPDHPKVQAAQEACQKFAAEVPKYEDSVVYDAGLALIFLCELAPDAHRREIENLVQFFVKNQKSHGGYGYSDRQTGDNSMTQYAALGLWLAHQNRFPVPMQTMAALTNWILAVQDPSGAFGYQGNVAPPEGPRVQQSSIRISLTTAGLCSLYVSADALQLGNRRARSEVELPPELVEITPQDPHQMRGAAKIVDRQLLQEAKELGNTWMEKNFAIDGGQWQFYYLYALERFKAFQELDLGEPDPNPKWYDLGVDFIRDNQKDDGSFYGSDEGAPVSTAFGVLFLVRGTAETIQKHVRKFDNGLLAGGRGLPENLSNAELRNGQVINASEIPETERFLQMLEEDDGSLEHLVDADVAFDLQVAPKDRPAALQAIRRKLREGSYSARLMAVRALKESKDFESVPALIFALSDPDPRIVKEARDALRFISRKLDGFGMPAAPSVAERDQAIRQWKAWYLSLRPDANFWD